MFTENVATGSLRKTDTAKKVEASPEYAVQKPRLISPASIAVLPFIHSEDGQETTSLADGITEELSMGLSKFKWLTVIAHQSTRYYQGKQNTMKEVVGNFDATSVSNLDGLLPESIFCKHKFR